MHLPVGALDMNYFKQNRCMALATNISVSVQLGWFKKLKPSLCKYKEGFYKFFFNNVYIYMWIFSASNLHFLFSFKTKCDNYFKKSLFLVVEIGGNDTNALISYKNISKLREIVPPIIEEIIKATIYHF